MPAPPLTERELLIALTTFRSSMNAIRAMAEAGFDPIHFSQLAIDDPQAEQKIRAVLERDLEMIDKEAVRRAAEKA